MLNAFQNKFCIGFYWWQSTSLQLLSTGWTNIGVKQVLKSLKQTLSFWRCLVLCWRQVKIWSPSRDDFKTCAINSLRWTPRVSPCCTSVEAASTVSVLRDLTAQLLFNSSWKTVDVKLIQDCSLHVNKLHLMSLFALP